MGLKAFFERHLGRRDPLEPLGFEISIGATPDSLMEPVRLIVKNDSTTPMEFVVQILQGVSSAGEKCCN
ncbi:MAG: hypothetical protein U5L08_05415 [Xanthomonadales bacterium]|nr:hypothetical protein [Xanthomonadales bacterium]